MKVPLLFGWFGKTAAALVVGTVCSAAFAAQQDESLNLLPRTATPSKSAQGQGFVGGKFSYLSGDVKDVGFDSAFEFRGIGKYGVTNEITASIDLAFRSLD